MICLEKEDNGYKLFKILSKADSSNFLGHSITMVINNGNSKDDFDWLITQLKDYVTDSRENLLIAVGEEGCDLIEKYRPFTAENH